MPVELIIDGYNLLHNAGLGRPRNAPGEFEKARNKLLKRLQVSLSETERAHTSVIFDAQFSEHPDRRPLHLYGMAVLFSPHGRQADDLIEILLSSHPAPQQVMVISSDHRLQRAARHARAAYLSSDAFLVELDERQLEQPTAEADPHETSSPPFNRSQKPAKSDVERWLQEFGEIDVNSIAREELQAELQLRQSAAGKQAATGKQSTTGSSPIPTPNSSALPTTALPTTERTGQKDSNDLPTNLTPSEFEMEGGLGKIIPLKEKPGSTPRSAGRSSSRPSDPSAQSASSPESASLPPGELSFWEQRIREMLDAEE